MKRRLLAFVGAITFLLSGCSYNGQNDKKTGDFYNSILEQYLDEATKNGKVSSEEGEKKYAGEDIKILASFDPSIETYRYYVLEEIKPLVDHDSEKGFGNFSSDFIYDYVFDRNIPKEVITASEASFSYDYTQYRSIKDNATVSIDSYFIEGENYKGYRQTITTCAYEQNALEEENSTLNIATNYVCVEKDGKTIENKTNTIAYTEDAVYSDGTKLQGVVTIDNFDFPTVTQGYLSLESGQTYTQSELEYVQDSLDRITVYNAQIDKDAKTTEEKRIPLK